MVAILTESRDFDRALEYARETVMPKIWSNAIDSQPLVSTLTGRIANAMFPEMGPMGRGKRMMGGESIVGKARLGKNETVKSLTGGYDTFDTTPQDNVRHSRFNWKLYGGTVNISEHEIEMNASSEAAVANIVQEEMTDAIESLVDLLGTHLYSNGGVITRVTDLDTLISAASENASVGGLSGSTYTHWNSRGISNDGTAPASVSFTPGTTSFASAGLANWRRAYNNASEGQSTQPEVIMTTLNIHEYYEAVIEPQHRVTNTRLADAGIRALQWKEVPVIPDRKCPSGKSYFMNLDRMYLSVLRGTDFQSTPFTQPDAQRVRISKVFVTCEMCIFDRKRQNKVIGQTA